MIAVDQNPIIARITHENIENSVLDEKNTEMNISFWFSFYWNSNSIVELFI